MASQLFSRTKSAHEIQLRRNRLRKILLETLERRELLAADLMGLGDYGSQSSYTAGMQNAQQPLAFTSLNQDPLTGYSVTEFLDSTLGGGSGDVSSRDWFPMIQESYDQWSRANGVQFSYQTQNGLQAEGEGVSSGLVAEGEAGGPRLLSVAPNSGNIFTFNDVNQLFEGPTELVFRFDGSSDLNPATLAGGIRVTRAGGDGVFGDGNDRVINPGYLGFGDNNRIVILRFASTLVDDLYRVELVGKDDPATGRTAIRNAAGLTLQTRAIDSTPADLNRDTVDFNLELGAQVLAVVPQPVDRVGGVLTPQRDKIRVYFNNDDLHSSAVTTGSVTPNPTVVDPSFYQLILTNDSIEPGDDQVFAPASISYDPATDIAELTFAAPIDQLAGAGTYRLRIGSRDAVVSTTNPQTITPQNLPDPAGNIGNATPLGTFSTAFSTVINQSIITTSTADLPLDFPGSNFEPGHRDIQDESHLGGRDGSPQISQIAYNFALNRPYGLDAANRPVNTSITPDQIARVREIFEFYSTVAGIDFVETVGSGLTIVVGDLFPLGTQSAPGGAIGVAGGGLAIMDGAETWDNSFGGRSGIPGSQNFFETAMHEIGHLLGLGHTYDLPPGTIMGDEGDLANPNPGLGGTEWSFPGDADVVHTQHLYRPDNRDVDTYSFVVPAGQSGMLTAETIAERLQNSSRLDTYLTLMKQTPTGFEIIAVNNDSNSSDSFLSARLTEGTYFVSVTGKGNENANPLIPNTGSGAVSQGDYQLRLDFKPDVAAGIQKFTIEDSTGTPLDGDGDGLAGGNFNFWFRTAAPVGVAAAGAPKTIYVDKGFAGSQTGPMLGSPTQPLNNLDLNNPTKWPAGLLQPGDVVRVVGSVGVDGDITTTLDNPAYEIGRGGVGNAILSDGLTLEVPRGVTMMIDAGAIFKLQGTRITTGSLNASINKSFSALQVLGTPQQTVNFTSYRDQSQGTDTNPLNTVPGPGDWGGLDFHNDIDRTEGFGEYERKGIFLNYVSHADMRFGGGQITVSSPSPTINPINMTEARPTLLHNTIRFSSDAAMSADPNSFEETRFTHPRYQLAENFSPDYTRVGPEIRGNTLTNNSTNGLFVRTSTSAGGPLTTLNVAARFDDADIVHVLGENLIIQGTPGGAIQETVGPDVSLTQRTNSSGGSLTVGSSVRYKLTAVDLNGAEGIPSAATPALTLTGNAVQLTALPRATGDFVARRLWRSTNGGNFELVAELDSDTTTYKDVGANLKAILANPNATSTDRARLDSRLQIDPGIIVKSTGSRIEAAIGAQLIAEGTSDRPIVFTSRFDDRFGAGGTFDTNSDGNGSNPSAGDWGGLVARHLSSMSIDNALITFGGGVTSVAGAFTGFNAIEIHQAEARVSNTTLEMNASGLGGNAHPSRDGRGPHDASVIFVTGAQPVLINNTIQNNGVTNTAAISINANAMTNRNVTDPGRQTGDNQRIKTGVGNVGPLVDGNSLLGNSRNGMRIRGETLTTETVWDDSDIVHVLQSEIVVPDFHTYGGIRLQSKVDESLVVKLGSGAGITALGRPLDITDRIGGSLRIVGTPGFPVVLTSLADDSVGAGFDPNGRALVDTNNNGPSTGSPGDWRSIRLEPYANDRNVDAAIELESDAIQDSGTNDTTGFAQNLGGLASSLIGGDENLRLGFSVDGVIAAPQDLDVYSFTGTAGTSVWIDIDHTNGSLDSVVELIDVRGNIIAQSNNSLAESAGTESRFVTADAAQITPDKVLPLDTSPFAPANSFAPGIDRDLYSVNPRDAGMRIVLPGATGAANTYYIRVRSSNLAPGDPVSKLQDPAAERAGLSKGNYRLQVRLQQEDEVAGSSVRYADIRFATIGIETRGMPGSSPLLGQVAEGTGTTNLGNIINSDRGSVTVAGFLNENANNNVDLYSFTVQRGSTQVIDPTDGATHISTVFDVDYADGFGRPDTTLWVFDSAGRLVLVGTDSNIADDRSAPRQGADLDDLTRGSSGSRDPFIGAAELPPGNYTVAVTNTSQIATALNQYQQANASNPLVRLEPINSVNRIAVDRFEGFNLIETANPPQQVAFSNNIQGQHSVQWTLADVTTYLTRNQGNGSRLVFANAYTGALEADISNFVRVNDAIMSPDGRLVGFEIPNNNVMDSNSGNLHLINSIGAPGAAQIPNNASTVAGNSGIQTYTTQQTAATAFAIQQRDRDNNFGNGNTPQGDGIQFNDLTFHTSASDNNLRMFGVGSRGNSQTSFALPILDANNAVIGINPTTRNYNTTNIVYKLNPDTGAAINPGTTPANDRTGNGLVNGAGTQKIEFGRFLSGTLANDYTDGTVTGLAEINGVLYAVSNFGEFYVAPVGNGDFGFGSNFSSPDPTKVYSGRLPTTVINDPDTGNPVVFTSLTAGPRNLENGRFANMLFGTTSDGTIYAFDTSGVLQPVFPGFSSKIRSTSPGVGTGVQGIDFSPLDVNLWHLTNQRDNEAGHGRTIPFDSSQLANELGDRSLYFGFENPQNVAPQQGDWSGVYDVAAYRGGYNLPGGAHGAVVSNPIDLRGYSADDQPMLYFNYLLDTEGAASDLDQADSRMRDAFRVYGAGEDGNWILLTTNNTPRDNGSDRNQRNGFVDELDTAVNNNRDPFFNPALTQETFDGAGWRQARTSLAAFAGQENIRLRFEFSTGATFRTGNSLLGGVELTAVAGAKISDGEFFDVVPQDGVSTQGTQRFEFDLGLVLNLPGGASLTSGSSAITINGTVVTFSQSSNTGNNVLYSASDTPAQIASRLRSRLPAILGIAAGSITTNPLRPNVLNVAGLPTTGPFSVANLPTSVIEGTPGTTAPNSIPINQAMTANQVRDAIRTSLAARFNNTTSTPTANASALQAWPFHQQTIRLFKFDVPNNNNTSLGLTRSRSGDAFGVQNDGTNRLDERAQNNAFEGVYVDDIIVGLAERGEMVFDATANTSFTPNLQKLDDLYAEQLLQVDYGRYQLTVRAAADYGITDTDTGDLFLARSFNSNDRLSQQVGIEVLNTAAGQIADGVTFTLGDGGVPAVFEFNVIVSAGDAADGVTPGNIPVNISANATPDQIALAIRDAINGPIAQNVLRLTASVQGEMSFGFFGDVALSQSPVVVLHGSASAMANGTYTFPGNSFLRPVVWGSETGFGEDLGDSERVRPQGQVLLVGNTITNSQDYGIFASAGNRNQSAIGDLVGNRPYPGAPINFPTPNTSSLAAGVVIVNNIVANNLAGGIRVQGDAGSDAPQQIARVLNNTIFGVAGADNGILIENGATPTILNNIMSNAGTGVRGPAGSSAVLGANVYKGNGTNAVGVGVGSFPIQLTAADPLFVDTTNRRFYLAAGAQAIDSSLEALQERPALAQLKNSLSIPPSPMIAPDLDVTGQRRVDDPTVNTPAGLGGNVFKDRGAVDRSDFVGLNAIILQPQDNDSIGNDVDRNTTFIQLSSGVVEFFSILLQDDNGTGPDPATVVSSAFVLTENGSLLVEGVDYIFGYNANSRTVRITPVAGIWRTDSVYELTLNNENGHRLKVSNGAATGDGHRFTVTTSSGATVFELDSNGTVATNSIRVPFTPAMTDYEIALQLLTAINGSGTGLSGYLQGDGTLMLNDANSVTTSGASVSVQTIGAIRDLAGNPLFANRSNSLTQFTIVMPEAVLDYGDAGGVRAPTIKAPNSTTPLVTNGNGARHALLPVDVPLLAMGRFVDSEPDGKPSVDALGDDNTGLLNLSTLGTVGGLTLSQAGPASAKVPAAAGLDGQAIVITDHTSRTVKFEFDTGGGLVDPTATAVSLLVGDSASTVATKLAAAVTDALLNGRLFDVLPIANGDTVSFGGSPQHRFNFSGAPGLQRVLAGNLEIVVPASLAGLADGQRLEITDGSGRTVIFELDDAAAVGVAAGFAPINVDLATADANSVATAIAAAINKQITDRKLVMAPATANGAVVTVGLDDEDGVKFGGLFNERRGPIPVTVTSTGAGLVDAWFDWNADGDFDDLGEYVIKSQPAAAGDNVYFVQTPVGAAIGFTTTRFRLSALGNLLPGGLAVGGEVEDHMIEILDGSPPIVANDSYAVDEDNVLTVSAAAGVLVNDFDADGDSLRVVDSDPATPATINPLVDVANGVLVLNADGSFQYTPNADFYGTDSFVYLAMDARLISALPATVTLTVNPINDAPLAIDDTIAISEDQSIVRSGDVFTANDFKHNVTTITNENGQVLTLDSARILSHVTSDLGVAGLRVRFASQGTAGTHGIRVRVTSQDLGLGVAPTVVTSANTVNVTLNSHAASPSTVSDLIAAINANAGSMVLASLEAGLGSTQIGASPVGYSPIAVPPSGGSVSVNNATNQLSYTPPAQYNNNVGGPAIVELTIIDDATPVGSGPRLTSTSTLTINIAAVNDSPEFVMPATHTSLETNPAVGLVTVPNFLNPRRPGPVLAGDEGTGPAINTENQQVTYTVRALNPSLFFAGDPLAVPPIPDGLPKIDANGTLTYRLAADVNVNTPFPQILVEVIAVDSGATSFVLANRYDAALAFPTTNRTYDGALLTVVDTNGNTTVFELDDVNLPGVGSTSGVGHVAVAFDSSDTALTINRKLAAAISAPNPLLVRPGGVGPWVASAYADSVSGELRFAGQTSVTSSTTTPTRVAVLENLFPAIVAGTSSYDGATFTLTDASGDSIRFEFNDTTNAAPATAGVAAGNAAINYDPSFTRAQLTQAIHAAINAPPAAILAGLTGTWEIQSRLSGNRMQLSGVTTVALSTSTATVINPLQRITVTALNPYVGRATNTSVPQTFTITPTPVNDAPQFTLAANPTSLEDQGRVTVPGFMSGIRPGPTTALDEAVQTLSISYSFDAGAYSEAPQIDLATGNLTYKTAPHVNSNTGHDLSVVVTVIDNGGVANGGVDRTTGTFTINVTERNDAPVFDMPTATSAFDEDPSDPVVTVPNFVSNVLPGPNPAGAGAINDEGAAAQTVTFRVTALDPSLFFAGDPTAVPPIPNGLPKIDPATGTLTFRLNDDVNQIMPFPVILVEVVGVDTGAGGDVLINRFDPRYVFPSVPNMYDGAKITIVDTAGNSVVFELEDAVNAPGVGTTGGLPNAAIVYDATDTRDTLNQKIVNAINNPPAASLKSGGVGPWTVRAYIDAVTQEIKFTGQASVTSTAPAARTILENVSVPPLAAGTTYDGATFTLTDVDGDSITFEFNDTTQTAPATPGVALGHVAINYDPTFTQTQLSQAINTAINNPPAALAASWNVVSVLPVGSQRLQLSGVVNTTISTSTATVINPLTAESLVPVFSQRLANESVPRTFTILPDAINDAPEFTFNPAVLDPAVTAIPTIAATEDQGVVSIPDFIIDARPGPLTALDELVLQSMTIRVEAVDPLAFKGAVGDPLSGQPKIVLDSATGKGILTFETNTDVNSMHVSRDLRVRVILMDNGGTANPGDVDTTTKTFSISVKEINDAPIFALPQTNITVFEDQESIDGTTQTVFPAFANPVQPGPLSAVDELSQILTFSTVSVSNPGLFSVLPAINGVTGNLTFTTAAHQNGQAVVVVRLTDNGPGTATGNGDDNQARPDQTFTINITPVNDPPEFSLPTITNSQEDAGLVTVSGFVSDLLPGPAVALDEATQQFTVNVNVQPQDVTKFAVLPAIAADGTLTYQMAPDVNGDFLVEVFVTDNFLPPATIHDNNTSPTATFTISVAPINDEPQFTLTQTQVDVIEDVEAGLGTGVNVIAGFATNIRPGPATAIDETGQLLNFEVISVSAPELFVAQPAISATTGALSFATNLHKNGKAVVVVRLVDNGVTAPVPNDHASGLQTFTISIAPINDAPQFDLPTTITVDEDAGLISRNGFATNVRRGPIGSDDENSQTVRFEVEALNPALFSLQPAIGVDGTLTFQTALNVNSHPFNSPLIVRTRLIDSGLNAPPPNVNTSAWKTFTVVVNPVNDAPVADAFSTSVDEDQSVSINAAAVLLGDVAGPTPDELSQALRITQVQRTSVNGGSIVPILAGDGSILSFTYTPALNFVGQDTFLYVVTDDGTPQMSGTGTIVVNVAGVNDAPQFNRGPDQFVPEDAGNVSIPNWATGILGGPLSATDEASQIVTFNVTALTPGLFAVQPAVSSNGTLTYRPANDANGSSVVVITAVDNGSPVATSPSQTFTISVNPINDAPVFTSGPNVNVAEDSGAYSQAWASSIAPAAGLLATPQTAQDESTQTVRFEVTTDRPDLFSLQPAIDATGRLQFTTLANASGQAVVTVVAVDNGPANALDMNRSVAKVFTISITEVNDAPVANPDNYRTNEDTLLAISPPGLLSNDTDADTGDVLTAVAGSFLSDLGASVVISADGSMTYDPKSLASFQQLTSGQSVADTFTYRVRDAAGALSAPATVTITIDGVDDAPVANNDTFAVGVGQTVSLSVLSNDTDVDSTIDPRTIVITGNPAFGTATVNQTGIIVYTPEGGFRGTDRFTYTVRDSSGNVSNEATVTLTVNSPPLANNDSAATFKNAPIEINVLANDQDPDGSLDPASVRIEVGPGAAGTAQVLSNGRILFTPANGFSGTATFSYTVRDNVGVASNVATVSVRVQNSRWRNSQNSLDVNGDGFVSPIDALIIINYLNSDAERFLPNSGVIPPPFLDPNDDEMVTPTDVLQVINFLNANSQGGGSAGAEGEQSESGLTDDKLSSLAYVTTVTPEQMVATVGPQLVREIQNALGEGLAAALDSEQGSSAPPIVTGASRGVSVASDEDDVVDLLSCSRDELHASSPEDAVDEFFGTLIGPHKPR